MSNKTLATFRIEENDWLAFKTWAESRGSNASSELVKYALTCIGKIKTDNQLPNLDKSIDNYLDANLDERIDKRMNKKLAGGIDNNLDTGGDMKNRIESLEKQIELLESEQDTSQLENNFANNEKFVNAIASQIKELEDKINPLLAAEQDANKLANDEKFIASVANEVKKS